MCKVWWDTLHKWENPQGQGSVGGGAEEGMTAGLRTPGIKGQP